MFTAKNLKEIILSIPDDAIICASQNEEGIDCGHLRLADWDRESGVLNLLFSYGEEKHDSEQNKRAAAGVVLNMFDQESAYTLTSDVACSNVDEQLCGEGWDIVINSLKEVLK